MNLRKNKSIIVVLAILLTSCFFLESCMAFDISFDMEYFADRFSGRYGNDKVDLPVCKDCNIILISLDTLRADRMGLFGYYRNDTPNLDRLSGNMIIFNRTFSTASHTLAGHMSIFTGKFPLEHKMNKRDDPELDSDIKTLPEIMKSHAYTTIWSGTLVDSNLDLNRGFERGFDVFKEPILTRQEESNTGIFPSDRTGKKYFIFLHSYIDHAPYLYSGESNRKFTEYDYSGLIPRDRKEFEEKIFYAVKPDFMKDEIEFMNRLNISTDRLAELKKIFYQDDISQFSEFFKDFNLGEYGYANNFIYYGNYSRYDEEDKKFLSDSYDNGVLFADMKFRQFYDSIPQSEINRTIIVITSDHGEELMEHGNIDHQSFYDEVIRVPLIIIYPKIKNRTVINDMTQTKDIMPMILGMAGIEENHVSKHEDYSYGFSFGKEYIRNDDWKLIKNKDGIEEIYYIRRDKEEKTDLIKKKDFIIQFFRNSLEEELTKWERRQAIGQER